MNRRLRPPLKPLTAVEHREPAGLSFADVFAPLNACFTTVVDAVTDDTMQAVTEHFDSIKFRVGHEGLDALRRAIRVVVAEKLLQLLKERIAENDDEPETLTQVSMSTTREVLIEFLTTKYAT